MKKTFKKLFAAVLAAALVLAMAVPAFAVTDSGTNGTINIKNTVKDETYTIYRIFDLESFTEGSDGKDGSYSYKLNAAWKDFAETSGFTQYFELFAGDYIKPLDNFTTATAAEFSQAALTWAKNNITASSAYQKTSTETGSTVTFTGLPLGYYLVGSSLGALCSLDTTNTTADVTEKNEVPTLTKEVVDAEGSTVTDSTAKIGDTVYYKVEITVEKGTQNYLLSDTMSEGLTFNSSSLAVSSSNNVSVATGDYTFAPDGNGFKLSFTDDFVARVGAGSKIVVTYNATLNEKAAVGNSGNTNSATLTYGGHQSVTQTTTTRTYEFDLIKVDGKANEDGSFNLLDGAEFELSDNSTVIRFVQNADGSYRTAKADENGVTTITVKGGKVRISGLAGKTYTLTETKAPDGYNKLTSSVSVDLSKGSKLTSMTGTTWNEGTDGEGGDGGVAVKNNAGTLLPSTGGMGTTLFYVIGGGLMIAAVVLLIAKKRMERKN